MANKNKICFLIPYYGSLPKYLKLFLHSCRNNLSQNFYFISDLNFPENLPSNVKVVRLSIDQFSKLIYQKTGVKPNITFGWKICDFKPALGFIFSEYISEFEFWGIIDIDIILGCINSFFTESILNDFDIISTRQKWLSGSFAIFRNIEKVNRLFFQSKDWEYVFTTSRHCAFDECGRLKIKEGQKVYTELLRGKSIIELNTDIQALTHLLANEQKKSDIKILFNDLICEKIENNMILKYNDGNLTVHKKGGSGYSDGHTLLHYHFVNDKNSFTFKYPSWLKVPEVFFITKYGFYKNEQLRLFEIKKPYIITARLFYYIFKKMPPYFNKKFMKLINIKDSAI